MSSYFVKQSVETWLPCILVDDTDFKSPETGVAFGTPTVKYAKEGDTSLTTKTLLVTDWQEIGNGVYFIKFSTTELNTVGKFVFTVYAAGILYYYGEVQITAALLDDLSGRLPTALVSGRMDSSVGAMASGVVTAAAVATDAIDADALAADAVAEIQSGLATAAAVATVQADTDDIQTRLPAALVSGRMSSYVGAMAAGVVDAAAIATDAIDADALAASAVTEIQAGLATAAAVAAVQADTDDLQTRVPAALVSGRMDSSVGAMATDVLTAAALAASAVTEIQTGLATAAAVAAVQADTDDIQSRLPAALVGGRMRAHAEAMDADVIGASQIAAGAIGAAEAPLLANLDAAVSSRAAPGAAMDLVANAVDAAALAADAIVEIDTGLSSTHGAGTWESATPEVVASTVWDKAKAGHVAPGSFGEEVQSHATPAEVTTQLAAYGTATGAQVATRAAPGAAMDLVADAVDAAALAASALAEIDAALSAVHGAGSWQGGGSPADIADAVWDEATAGHAGLGSFGEEVQSHATPAEVLTQVGSGLVGYGAATGAEVASRAAPGDAMDLVSDAVDASSLAASAVTEINAGLSAAHGVGAWEGPSAPAVADAVWDEAKAGHTGLGSFGEEVQSHATPAEVLTQVGSGLTAYDAATGAQVATRAAPGDEMDLVAGAVDKVWDELAAGHVGVGSLGLELQDKPSAAEVDAALSAAHGAGSWEGASAAAVADAVWDEAVAGHSAPGSTGLELQDKPTAAEVDAQLSSVHGAGPWDDTLAPALVAAAVWDEAKAGHVGAGSFGEEVQSHATPAEVKTQADQALVDYDPLTEVELIADLTAVPPAVDALLTAAHGSGSWGSSEYVYVVKQSYSYNPLIRVLTGNIWVEQQGLIIPNPTSLSCSVYDADGVLMFTVTDVTPDANGIFKVVKTAPGFSSNQSYYALATVTGVWGTLRAGKGLFTVG